MKITSKDTNARKEHFFSSLGLADATIRNYKTALNCNFIKEYLSVKFNCISIFEIIDLEVLYDIYVNIRVHPKNIETHRVCSAAIMKYIRFLNDGKKIGRRIDYKIPRPCMRRPRKSKTIASK